MSLNENRVFVEHISRLPSTGGNAQIRNKSEPLRNNLHIFVNRSRQRLSTIKRTEIIRFIIKRLISIVRVYVEYYAF